MPPILDLEIGRFGPIRDSQITISNLTVFMGPYATGKSLVQKLIFSFLRSLWNVITTVKEIYVARKELFLEHLKLEFVKEVKRIFAPEDILRKSSFRVVLRSPEGFGLIVIENREGSTINIDISYEFIRKLDTYYILREELGYEIDACTPTVEEIISGDVVEERYASKECADIARDKIDKIREYLEKKVPELVKPVIPLFLSTTREVLVRLPFVQVVDPFLTDIMLNIMYVAKEIGSTTDLASLLDSDIKDIVSKIVHGSVEIEECYTPLGPSYTLLLKTREGEKIPLTNASSGVCNIVGMIVIPLIYLKSIKERVPSARLALLVEEPELSVHPDLQLELCRLLVRIVRKDNIILLSTHSDYIVLMLSILSSISKLDEDLRYRVCKELENLSHGRVDIDPKYDIVDPSSISAYLFKPDGLSVKVEDWSAHIRDIRLVKEIPYMTDVIDKVLTLRYYIEYFLEAGEHKHETIR